MNSGRLVFLFRHADKEMSSGSNPPLSKMGHEQALRLKSLCLEKKMPIPEKVWVSPKIRTMQSMEPAAGIQDLSCEVLSDLSERLRNETSVEFENRIKKVLREASQGKGVLFLCTHYDWCEEAFSLIPTPDDQASPSFFSWHPLSYCGFEIIEDRWHFISKGQVLP